MLRPHGVGLIAVPGLAPVWIGLGACSDREKVEKTGDALSDEAVGNLVRRSCQYVAIYDVNDELALPKGATDPRRSLVIRIHRIGGAENAA